MIDGEVSKLLREAEERAVNLLSTHRTELDGLVNLLLEKETVDGSDVYRLAGRPNKAVSLSEPAVEMAPHAAGAVNGAPSVVNTAVTNTAVTNMGVTNVGVTNTGITSAGDSTSGR